jgi:DNA-binding CsgD family transcriptional regulator
MIAAERARAGATRAALDHWAHAAIVLDTAARVITHNRAAETLFRRADQIWLGADGRLRAADAGKVRQLEVAVRRCAAMVDHTGDDVLDGIALPSRSGAAPLRVAVWSLPASANPANASAGVLMVIFDPAQEQHTPVGWLAKQFGLLPSEQRLTEAIVNGMPLAQAAEHLGIRLSTARTRLKTIQIKTNCRRQVDLVRLALSLSAVRQD